MAIRIRHLIQARIAHKAAFPLESRDCRHRQPLSRCWYKHPKRKDCSSNNFSFGFPLVKRAGFGFETRLAKHIPVQPATALIAAMRKPIGRDGHKFTLQADCHSRIKCFWINFNLFVLGRCGCDAINRAGGICGHRNYAWRFAIASHFNNTRQSCANKQFRW